MVLVVRFGQNGRKVSDMNEPLTIVVGYDGSHAARRGLGRVRDLGERASKVLVVAVVPALRSAGLATPLADDPLDAQRLLQEAFDMLERPERMHIELREATGDPGVVLVDIAREAAADLLIIGRQGGDFVARTLLGSVAQRAVQHAPCDVLVVA
jgi:nucleotide-binding universal stress UspA family protein